MKVLVLGASGHIGNAIVRELLARGHDVTGAARAASPAANLAALDVRYYAGDLNADGTIDEWCEGQDVVIDSAAPYAINLLTAKSEADQRPLEYASQRIETLIGAAAKHGTRLVYVSSAHADPSRKSSSLWALQRRFVRALHPYFAIKKLTEDRIRAAMNTGFQATILRPTACVGPWDIKSREDCWIPKLLSGEIPGILSHRVNIMDTRDVATAVAAAVEGVGIGETAMLTGHNTTTEELVAHLCNCGGVAAPRMRIPAELSVIPLMWTEALWAMIGSASPLPSLVPALLCEQSWLEESDYQRQLGVPPRPLTETASDTVSWYQSLGYC